MNVHNDELVNVRDFRANTAIHLDSVRNGQHEKLVITRNGQMEAVVLSVAEYEKLVAR